MEPLDCDRSGHRFGLRGTRPLANVLGSLTWLVALAVALVVMIEALGMRYIPNNRVGIVEKLWSPRGSVPEGRIIALDGEAGFQADLLRGGLHFGYWRWQYRIHKVPLVTVPQGKIGYVYARDGEPLPPSQTLGRVVECNNFQDARAFLVGEAAGAGRASPLVGQRGRQRAILREGVYAINLALFVVITEDAVYRLDARRPARAARRWSSWQTELNAGRRLPPGRHRRADRGARPAHPGQDDRGRQHRHRHGPRRPVAGAGRDHRPGGRHRAERRRTIHNNYQDPEAFLARRRPPRPAVRAADRRHLLHQPLVRHGRDRSPRRSCRSATSAWSSATTARPGQDVSGDDVPPRRARRPRASAASGSGRSGRASTPFNTYAGNIILVPTTNFVLHWVTGRTETHRYDESLRSIDLVTKDAYEPLLPLSVVVHIDYQKAPSVIQRFGDVKKLITQTLDPMLSAYFRDVAHKKTMLAAAPASATRSSTRPARSCGGGSASSTSSASTC